MFPKTSTPIVQAAHTNGNLLHNVSSCCGVRFMEHFYTVHGIVIFQSQSPPNVRSQKNLKLAAMKRMRDAGWTAVTGNAKKKKTNEKIFA